jgi:hypothetical protein
VPPAFDALRVTLPLLTFCTKTLLLFDRPVVFAARVMAPKVPEVTIGFTAEPISPATEASVRFGVTMTPGVACVITPVPPDLKVTEVVPESRKVPKFISPLLLPLIVSLVSTTTVPPVRLPARLILLVVQHAAGLPPLLTSENVAPALDWFNEIAEAVLLDKKMEPVLFAPLIFAVSVMLPPTFSINSGALVEVPTLPLPELSTMIGLLIDAVDKDALWVMLPVPSALSVACEVPVISAPSTIPPLLPLVV